MALGRLLVHRADLYRLRGGISRELSRVSATMIAFTLLPSKVAGRRVDSACRLAAYASGKRRGARRSQRAIWLRITHRLGFFRVLCQGFAGHHYAVFGYRASYRLKQALANTVIAISCFVSFGCCGKLWALAGKAATCQQDYCRIFMFSGGPRLSFFR